MIRCDKINLSFGDKIIFENMNIHIRQGEHLCLSAESGRGKSTLLKMLQGYVSPQDGEITIAGIRLEKSSIKKIRDKIIWIPQNINFPIDTGLELLHLMEIKQNINLIYQYLNSLGLDKEILNKKFTEISGGQKQRIIIAICLSIERPIILLDEPTSSLDNNNTNNLARIIKSLVNKTILSASHDSYWHKFADRVLYMDKL